MDSVASVASVDRDTGVTSQQGRQCRSVAVQGAADVGVTPRWRWLDTQLVPAHQHQQPPARGGQGRHQASHHEGQKVSGDCG